ncbi:MAG: aldehyde ferredoxin oxidoreductase C-terminal domain-containing protein, partial [Candidatus Hodarchaeales archaeon]
TLAVPYDFELLYALGSNLEIGNGLDVLKLIEQTERLGMDAITTGVVLGWLAEAFEKELITKDDTNGLEIRFGNVDSFIEAIKRIASRDSNNKDIFWYAGEGLNALVKKYGGNDFAIMINSHPPAGYSTGPYTILGHYIGARHSHLDNAGYSLDQKALNKHYTPQQAVEWLLKEEEWRNVLNSLVACLFARKIYTPELVVECLSNIGISKSQEELLELGRKIQKLRIETKLKFGMDYPRSMASLPKRFFQMPTAHGKIPEKLIKEKLYSSFRKTAKERYNIQI